MISNAIPRSHIWLLLGINGLCFFVNLGAMGLFDYNEGLYVQTAREMHLRGDWVTPTFNGVPWFHKPPLALWLVILSFKVFGVSEWAARLPVALAASAMVMLTYWAGRRWFSDRIALFAAAILAFSPLLFGTARQMTMDIHQSLWFAVAMLAFYQAVYGNEEHRTRWSIVAWAGCGLSFMSKSIPGLFPLFIVACHLIWEFRRSGTSWFTLAGRTRPLVGTLVFLAIVVPWHAALTKHYGRVFWDDYFLFHHVGLATGQEFGHKQPVWYYLPAMAVCFAPWFLVCLPALKPTRGKTSKDQQQNSQEHLLTYLNQWAWIVLLLFSIMPSKVVSYLIPLFPAIAIMAAHWLDAQIDAAKPLWLKRTVAAAAIVMIVMLGAALQLQRYVSGLPELARFRREYPPDIAQMTVLAFAVGAPLIGAAAWVMRRDTQRGVTLLFGALAAFYAVIVLAAPGSFQRRINGPLHDLSRMAGSLLQPSGRLVTYISNPIRPSTLFYLPADRVITPDRHPAPVPIHLETGSEQETLDEFDLSPKSLILTDRKRADELLAKRDNMTVLAAQDRWRLLGRASDETHESGFRP